MKATDISSRMTGSALTINGAASVRHGITRTGDLARRLDSGRGRLGGRFVLALGKLRPIRSALAWCLLASAVVFSSACQQNLPMSVDEVWQRAGGDANMLAAVVNEAKTQELKDLYGAFEQAGQVRIPGARMWADYAEKAQQIERDYRKLRDKVFDDFKNRSN